MKTKLIGVLSLAAIFFVSTSGTSVAKATPINPTETFESESAIGGYRIDEATKSKQQIIGFGFKAKESVLPGPYYDYGITLYEEKSCETYVDYRDSSDIDTLIAKKGRFYAIFDCSEGSSPNPGTTYYARAYLHYVNEDGEDVYHFSSVVSAKSNLTTQYTIPE